MAPGPTSRTWRRYLRLSVRGQIVLVLVVGAGLGWVVRSARTQRRAVAAITSASGIVVYDWEWSDGRSIPRGKPWAPKDLVDDERGSDRLEDFGFTIEAQFSLGVESLHVERIRQRRVAFGSRERCDHTSAYFRRSERRQRGSLRGSW
jgi:hypothetical protein